MWGEEELVKENPIQELFKLYVKFHEEAEKNDHLNEEGREAFLKLEQGVEEYIELWKWFREVSLASFNKIYNRLGVPLIHIMEKLFTMINYNQLSIF